MTKIAERIDEISHISYTVLQSGTDPAAVSLRARRRKNGRVVHIYILPLYIDDSRDMMYNDIVLYYAEVCAERISDAE